MRELTEIWYDKFANDKGVRCQSIYIIGQLYGISGGQYELKSLKRVADMVILSFDGGVSYEVPITDDMSFVYKDVEETDKAKEDANEQSEDK